MMRRRINALCSTDGGLNRHRCGQTVAADVAVRDLPQFATKSPASVPVAEVSVSRLMPEAAAALALILALMFPVSGEPSWTLNRSN